ncbi:transporter substrate-binding domain-containing protein [Aliiroseovarius sp. KMU-50]|uniref:Transporter substrate-binding domain-containing protein n=1 Tax=Aliiroseovarius salicola TaxID=3009082 RepID=A0ABT4W2B7_9RHOB|nr:transporter substrate-binding domain-containing protein [Aliiroseovarius sp. KMU-50]MDA5094664.1 transporter substrate-binding domain-containing protein [Aliiroseovarius sp. KMU-50]
MRLGFHIALVLGLLAGSAQMAWARCEDLAKGYGDVIPKRSDTRINVGQDYDTILERGFLTFAVYENFAPFSWEENGKPLGIDIEVARIIAQDIGVEARFNFVAADENVDADLRNQIWKGPLIGGQVSNIMMHVPYSKDLQCRNEFVVLNGQYFNETLATAYRLEVFPDDPPTTPYYRFHKVGVENHTISDFYLSNFNGGMLLSNILHYPEHEDAFTAMEAGEVDAVMGVKSVLEHLDQSDEIEVATPPLVNFSLDTWTLGIAVRHNFRELSYAADYAISDAIADGRITEIFRRYGVSHAAPDY